MQIKFRLERKPVFISANGKSMIQLNADHRPMKKQKYDVEKIGVGYGGYYLDVVEFGPDTQLTVCSGECWQQNFT